MSEPEAKESAPRFEGVTVLVVEDETMIALLIEDMLLELGCREVWHASSVADAITRLADRRPDIAMLDVNLNRELVYPVAAWLQGAGIPFLFATGYGGAMVPEEVAAHPLLHKPFTVETLAAALGDTLERARAARSAADRRRA